MKTQLLAATVAASLALSVTVRAAHADEPSPSSEVSTSASASTDDDDPTRYPPPSTRWKLILTGFGVTGLAYAVTLASSFAWDDVPGSGALKIPYVGPWIAVAQNKCSPSNRDCGALLYVRGALEVVSGIVQDAAIGLVVEGIVMTTQKRGPAKKAASFTMLPVPMVGPDRVGMTLVGTF